ncbi:hypothetical protein [Flavobacterium sp.]
MQKNILILNGVDMNWIELFSSTDLSINCIKTILINKVVPLKRIK